MKFEFWTTPGHSHLKAIFEENDSLEGKREEGAGTPITLEQKTVTFDYEVQNIHPDLLGLLCLITFFPFIGTEAEFPQPVSSRLYEAFQNKCFTDKKDISFRNISPDVEVYVGHKVALSFGGGIDSSAVREMFPEAFVVHEAHIRDGTVVHSHSHHIVKALEPDGGRLVSSNIRYLSHPGGWHSWPCSVSTSLLMATDRKIGLILTGSVLGSCFLSNGVKFWDRVRARAWHGPSGNYWQSAFETIGITMFSPVTGVSEMQTMKLSNKLLSEKKVVYCMEANGSACNSCSKCFRRAVIRTYIEPDFSPNWNDYNTPSMHQFLAKRPLYFGHIFSTCFSLKPELYPDWILNRITDLVKVDSDWTMRCYQNSFLLCPLEWREFISTRVLEFIQPMTEDDSEKMRSWNQSSTN